MLELHIKKIHEHCIMLLCIKQIPIVHENGYLFIFPRWRNMLLFECLEFHVVQTRRSTHLKALKLWNDWSGEQRFRFLLWMHHNQHMWHYYKHERIHIKFNSSRRPPYVYLLSSYARGFYASKQFSRRKKRQRKLLGYKARNWSRYILTASAPIQS